MNPDAWWRTRHHPRIATDRAIRLGELWVIRHRHYAPTTATQAADDHDADQARTEATDTFRGGNR